MAARYWFVTGNGSANWNTAANWYTSSAHTTPAGAAPTSADDVFLDAASGSGSLIVSATGTCNSLDMTGFTGTLTINFGLTVNTTTGTYAAKLGGNFGGTSNLIFAGTGGPITCNGAAIAGGCTFNSATGNWNITDAFVCLGALGITTGNITAGSITLNTISSSNSNVRSLTCTTMTHTGAGAFSIPVQTNLTFSGINLISNNSSTFSRGITLSGVFAFVNVTIAGSDSGTITFSSSPTAAVIPNVLISNTGGASLVIGASTIKNLEFAVGCNVSVNSTVGSTYTGNFKLVNTITVAATGNTTLTGTNTGTANITLAGATLTSVVTLNDGGANSTFNFLDDFNSTSSTTNAIFISSAGIVNFNGKVNCGTATFLINSGTNITFYGDVSTPNLSIDNVNTNIIIGTSGITFNLYAGSFNLTSGSFNTTSPKDYNVIAGIVSIGGSAVRTLNMGNGTWTLSGGNSTVWGVGVATNLTLIPNNSTIILATVGGGTTIFQGAGLTYGNFTVKAKSLSQINIQGANTFKTFSILTTAAESGNNFTIVQFPGLVTNNFENFIAVGDPTITHYLTTGGSQATLNKTTPGIISGDYLNIARITVTPAYTWYAGLHSVESIASPGWLFIAPPPKNLTLLGVG